MTAEHFINLVDSAGGLIPAFSNGLTPSDIDDASNLKNIVQHCYDFYTNQKEWIDKYYAYVEDCEFEQE